MGRASGAGYPHWFNCPTYRQIYPPSRTDADRRNHTISLTGRTRPTKRNGRGHPRKSWTTREWRCSCGRTGWSSHIDLEHMAERSQP